MALNAPALTLRSLYDAERNAGRLDDALEAVDTEPEPTKPLTASVEQAIRQHHQFPWLAGTGLILDGDIPPYRTDPGSSFDGKIARAGPDDH